MQPIDLTVVIAQSKADGRWMARVQELKRCTAWGDTEDEAIAEVKRMALDIIANRRPPNQPPPDVRFFAVE
jgi:predicted RNase H-like HicB family nuclease